MVDDFLHDPVLAATCIFQEVLNMKPPGPFPPIQELRIFGLWTRKFMIDSSGFGTGKTMGQAIVTALRLILMTDRHVGIISDTFAQGKLFWTDYFDPWMRKCPLFANEIAKNNKGEHRLRHDADNYSILARNGSEAKTLPPNFMNDSKRMKSESWTDFVGDEWTSWKNLGPALNIIQGRVRRPLHPSYDENDPIFSHHTAFLGAADFTWRESYNMILLYQERIAMGAKNYELQAWNYLDYTKKWRQIRYGIDEENIENMMRRMTRDEIERVVLAHWMNDSTGFYSAREIGDCRTPECMVA